MDRQDFLKTLAEACQKIGWQVHACCRMRNHRKQANWAGRHKSEPGKLAISARFRRQTRLPLKELAARVQFRHIQEHQRPTAPMDAAAWGNRLRTSPTPDMKLNEPCYGLINLLLGLCLWPVQAVEALACGRIDNECLGPAIILNAPGHVAPVGRGRLLVLCCKLRSAEADGQETVRVRSCGCSVIWK